MNKNVIIIGASSGIGEALARLYSEKGFTVGLTARRFELLKKISNELPGKSYIKKMDVANTGEAMKILDDLIAELNGADIIIINAGIGFVNPDLDWEMEKGTVDINVAGFMAMANVAMKYFLKKGTGQLVGISSISALRGSSHAPAYSASKAFMSHYMEGLRLIAYKKNSKVYITDIQPGFVNTKMAKGYLFWVASVQKAARQIFNAIEKKKPHAYITRRWRLMAWLMKITPARILARFY